MGTNAAGLRQFLAEGGGILMGAQAWYWNYSKPLPDHPSNQLLTPLGIVLSGQYLTPPTTLAPTAPPSQLGNADVALACLNASCAGDTGSACYSTTSGTISGYTATCAWTDDYIPEGAAFWTTLQKVWGRGAVCGGGGWGVGGWGGWGGGWWVGDVREAGLSSQRDPPPITNPASAMGGCERDRAQPERQVSLGGCASHASPWARHDPACRCCLLLPLPLA